MSFRFTIGKKIGTGFSVLILFIIVVFGATFLAVNNGISTFQENDLTSTELIELIKTMNNENERKNLGRNLRAEIEKNYNADIEVKKIIKLYKEYLE